MFKKRMLLLGVAVASLGAIMVSAAMAGPTGKSPTGTSGNVGVSSPLVVAQWGAGSWAGNIPANGTVQDVADIEAFDNDGDYSMEVMSLTPTQAATQQAGLCGGLTAALAPLTMPIPLPIGSPGAAVQVGDYNITLTAAGTNSLCQVGGAIVTVNVEATGP